MIFRRHVLHNQSLWADHNTSSRSHITYIWGKRVGYRGKPAFIWCTWWDEWSMEACDPLLEEDRTTHLHHFLFTGHPHKLNIKGTTIKTGYIMFLILFQSHGSVGPPNWYDTDLNPFTGLLLCTLHSPPFSTLLSCFGLSQKG